MSQDSHRDSHGLEDVARKSCYNILNNMARYLSELVHFSGATQFWAFLRSQEMTEDVVSTST